MENKEKIERLKKEVKELEQKKNEKDKVNELLKKRNELKFTKLFVAGNFLKKVGHNISEWADAKNKEIEKEKKQQKSEEKEGSDTKETKKSSENSSDDLYEALFGKNELNQGLGF